MADIVISKVPSTLNFLRPTVLQNSNKKFSWDATTPYASMTLAEFSVAYLDLNESPKTLSFQSTTKSDSYTIYNSSDIVQISVTFYYDGYTRTVTLNANGGTISASSSWSGSGSSASKTVSNGGTYGTLPTGTAINPVASDTIKYSGYYFNGWYTTAAGGTQITSSTGVALASDQTIYANWAYSIQYNANGGTGAPSTQIAAKGGSITIPLTQPTRDGYRFAGWNTNSSGTGTSYSPGQSYSGTSLTLYAQWANTTNIKVYVNGQWVSAQVKVYNNGSWQNATVKEYNGSSWV